jgi:hypothetical protein
VPAACFARPACHASASNPAARAFSSMPAFLKSSSWRAANHLVGVNAKIGKADFQHPQSDSVA